MTSLKGIQWIGMETIQVVDKNCTQYHIDYSSLEDKQRDDGGGTIIIY